MGSVISRRIIGYVYILIQILVHGIVADQASSSFEVPLKRRKQVGVFAPVEDAQGNLIPYTEYLTITLLASPSIDARYRIDGSQTSAYNAAEIVVDTGSALLSMYLKNTTVPEDCKQLYERYPNSTIDQRLLTPLPANSPECRSFTYSVPDPNGDDCLFRITYGGGSTSLNGFAAQEEFAFENSTAVLGSSDVTLPSAPLANAGLGGMMTIAAVENATNCDAFPGLGGMDNNENSVVSQLVSQELIGRHALSVCTSLRDNASFIVFGPAIPQSADLNDVIMYNGTTIQSIQTESDAFEQSIDPLKETGLSSHYYVIVNGLQIGESDAIQGPLSAIIDTGFPAFGVTKSMLDQVNAQISANAQKNSLPVAGPGCFAVGPDVSLPEIVSRVIPNVTIFFTNETKVVIPGAAFAEVVVMEDSGREVCSTLLESSPQQLALGTAFFLNRFVQLDSALGIMRTSELEVCPSVPPGEGGWTVSDSISVKGSYTFPYNIAASAAAQTHGFVVMMVASILISIFFTCN
ncbi:hypothetical protein PSENEW3_00002527 [Picochlorum sp. SENEW3]|nr:hypothetical protein PSENEW3_00002527 [Picochlorum sp. SENEW3]